MQKGILLHFLYRDVIANSNKKLSDEDIERIVLVAMFMSPVIYAELAFAYEIKNDLPITVDLLKRLNDFGYITTLTNSNTLDEFIINRRRLYIFDEKRYSVYFKDSNGLIFPDNPLIITSSTTEYIENHLKQKHAVVKKVEDCKSVTDIIDYSITKRFSTKDHWALTIQSFNKIFAEIREEGVDEISLSASKAILNRELNELHNRKYLDLTYSSIIKNIPFIYGFDSIDDESQYDYQIYVTILEPIFKTHSRTELEKIILQWRSEDEFFEIIGLLYRLVINVQQHMRQLLPSLTPKVLSTQIVLMIREKRKCIKKYSQINTLMEFYHYLHLMESVLDIPAIYSSDKAIAYIGGEKQMNILLPTANMTEFKNALKIANENGFSLQRQVVEANTFHFHKGEKISIYIVKCESGSLGPSASMLTLTDAINNVGIDTIIFAGIAFGNYKKRDNGQTIGDILVSKQVWSYESGKIQGDKFFPRGDKCPATPWLLDRFQNSAINWNDSSVHFGVIASGEKLVNSPGFVNELMEKEPELIGGEMEGAGLVSVAERYKKDWILVKGISDWGENKTDADQDLVANNTFRYVFKTIKEYMI